MQKYAVDTHATVAVVVYATAEEVTDLSNAERVSLLVHMAARRLDSF